MNKHFLKIIALIYILLALVVMLPLFAPGFILTLDMVFVPHPPLPEYMTSSYLFHVALHYLSYVIPGDVLQKIILFGILAGSGIGMHRLAQLSLSSKRAAYFAGVVYVINPFVYERFMAGQYAVLMGYALLPFFARALLKFLKQPNFQNMWPLAVWVLAISIVSIHTLGLVALLTIVALAVKLWRNHGKQYVLKVTKYGAIGIGAVSILSSYWLVPTLLGNSRTAETIQNFSSADHQAFATDGGLLNVLQLQGFWAEAQGLFKPAGDLLPLSGIWQLCLWALIILGAFAALHKAHKGRNLSTPLIFGVTGVIAALLALGGPINQFFTENLPFFAGYREPHKFVALLALAYAFLGAWGAARILEETAKLKRRILYLVVTACLLVLPFLITPTMLWGFNGQLRPVHYPPDWYAVNEIVPKDEKVLFLPWHLYMNFGFTNRIVANPADKFFDARVITSSNPEFAGISQPSSEIQDKIDKEILPQADKRTNLGAQLKPLGISYILLAKELDYEDYAYITRQSDIKLIRETPTLMLYRNVASERSADAND